jgi:3-hydroxybutyryl-CoA dehydrogenase
LKSKTLENITIYTDLTAGASDADLMVEAATERIDLKLKIFTEADQILPQHAILASNTSSISITRIAAATQRPDKVIGMHFMNPVPVMKLVEVIRGYSTSGRRQTPLCSCRNHWVRCRLKSMTIRDLSPIEF